MVFLPCPRFRPVSDHSPNIENSSSISQPAVLETDLSAEGVNPVEQVEGRGEIADVLCSLVSRPGSRAYVHFRHNKPTSQAISARDHTIRQRKSRLSLISLPNKIRWKFSRDVPLSRRASDATPAGRRPNLSPDIFPGDRDNEDNYDSDAHYILTPQITQRLDGSLRDVLQNSWQKLANALHHPNHSARSEYAEVQWPEVDEFGRFSGKHIIGRGPPQDSGPPGDIPQRSVTKQVENSSCSAAPTQEDLVPRVLCSTPTDSYLEDQEFYTPTEGQSPARWSELVKGGTATNRIQSSSRKALPNRIPTAGERCRSQTPTPSQQSQGARRPIPREDAESTGNSATGASTSKPQGNLQSGPSRFEQPLCDAHQSISGPANIASPIRPGDTPITHEDCELKHSAHQSRDSTMLRGSKLYKHALNASFLSSSRIPSPKHIKSSRPGKLQVPKRSSMTGISSRFYEDFDDDPTVILQSQSGLQGKASSSHRVSSDGWLSGGKRVGYGYNFVTDLTPEKSTAAGDVPEGVANSAPQNAGCHTTALEEAKEKTNKQSEKPTTVVKAEKPETKTTRLRRSFSITSWLKYSSSAVKGDVSQRQALRDITAENSSTTSRTLNFTPGRGLLRSPDSTLFKPWRRLSGGDNSVEMRYERHIASPVEENSAGLDAVNENQQVHDSAIGGSSNSKIKMKPPINQEGLHDEFTSDFDAVEQGPSGYDGPFDVRLEDLVSRDESVYDAEQDEPGSLDISAEVWSRMYQECLPRRSLSREADAGFTGQNGRFRVGRGRRRRNVRGQDISMTTSSGELRPSSQFNDSQPYVQGLL